MSCSELHVQFSRNGVVALGNLAAASGSQQLAGAASRVGPGQQARSQKSQPWHPIHHFIPACRPCGFLQTSLHTQRRDRNNWKSAGGTHAHQPNSNHQLHPALYLFTVIPTESPLSPETPWLRTAACNINPPDPSACRALPSKHQSTSPVSAKPTQTPSCKQAQQPGISKQKRRALQPSRSAACCPRDLPRDPSNPSRWRGCARR